MNTHLLAQIRNPVLPDSIGGTKKPTIDMGAPATGQWISSLVSAMFIVAALAALLYFVLGGLAWVLSEGDKTKLEEARNRITHAILGLIIVASSWAIWLLVGRFLGINFTNIPFPTLGPPQ